MMSLLEFRRLAIRPSYCRMRQPLGRGVERERYRSTAGRPFDRAEGRSMQFFVLARRRTESFAEAQFAELLDAEAARVRELYGDGVIRSAYSRADVPGAILMLEAADVAEAQDILSTLPLVAAGMLETTIIHVRGYRGFAT